MVLTEEVKSDPYPAAIMETANSSTENALFYNIDNTRITKPSWFADPVYTTNNSVARVKNASGYQKTGPGILLKVMAGDSYNIRVVSGWAGANPTTPNNTNVLTELFNLLTASLPGQSGGKITQLQLQNPASGLNAGLSSFLAIQSAASQKPKASLNWLLFDEQFKVVLQNNNSSFDPITFEANTPQIHTKNNLVVGKSGYLYVYVSNESDNVDVFFDNLQVTHKRGPLLEETHYYPFGLTMAGISSKAASNLENRFKFNGKEEQRKEFSDGSGLEWVDFGHRMYDNQVGRFFTQDRMTDNFPSFSPYQYARNNPILYMDIMGDSAWKITNEWNDDFINKFQTFASDRAKQAYENGERYTCEDFAFSTIIDFSSQNGLPLVIENGETSLSASSATYNNVKDFTDAAFATTGANDLARPENAVQLSGTNSARPGDLLLHKVEAENGSKKVYGHVQVVASNTDRAIVVYQGNQRSGSADPNTFFSRYAGMKVQKAYYAKATGNYVRTDTKSVTPNLLNSGIVVPFRWNFTSWNKR